MRRWIESLAALAFPPRCVSCRTCMDTATDALCTECAREWLALTAAPYCVRCGRSAAGLDLSGEMPTRCIRCDERKIYHRGVLRVGAYDGPLRGCIRRVKFHRDLSAGRLLAGVLAEKAAPWLAERPIDLIVPMPMHWRRFAVRGINPPELLAHEIARATGMPLRRVLRRRHHRPSQIEIPARQRRRNVRGVFTVPFRAAGRLRGKHICLIDDVLTSGATAEEAIRTLRTAGAASAHVAVAAVADRIETGDP